MDYTDKFADIINIVLSPKNIEQFVNVNDITKTEYTAETQKRDSKLTKLANWEIPQLQNFGSNFIEFPSTRSVMLPFYYDSRWKTEEAFIKFLEQSGNIEWWFKNGDRDSIYFAVPYMENGIENPFYVDFIVMFKDGTIGLFDTKSGRTIKDAKEKSDGLQNYIKAQNDKSRKFTGGIVSNTNSRDYSGRWVYYTGISTDLNPEDFSNWTTLEINNK